MTRWFSLRRRLLALLLGGVTACWLAVLLASYVDAYHEVEALIEARNGDDKAEADEHARETLIEEIVERMLSPALLGLPFLALWIWLAIHHGLKPLDQVAREIAARDPGRLHPVAPDRAPEEVRPLLDALNSLLGRVERTLANERRFTADAAHELRTPLAALAVQSQVASRAMNPDERQRAIEQLRLGIVRAARLVEQLLTLARLDPADGVIRPLPVALDELAQEVCADHGSLALEKHIALELDASPVRLSGNGDMLRILLRNLVDNALRYTPDGGQVCVRVGEGADGGELSVVDSGPGIPMAERERAFDRFHRLAGQEIEGSGLGLSIVARIAELHGAKVALEDVPDGSGLRVTVRFPRTPR